MNPQDFIYSKRVATLPFDYVLYDLSQSVCLYDLSQSVCLYDLSQSVCLYDLFATRQQDNLHSIMTNMQKDVALLLLL